MRSDSSPRAVSRMIARAPASQRADAAHRLQAVDARQHEVEHHEVGPARGRHLHRLDTVECHVRLVARPLQVAAHDLADRRLVVDDQDRAAGRIGAHGPSVAVARLR